MKRAIFMSFMLLSLVACAGPEVEPAAQIDATDTLPLPAVQTSADQPAEPRTPAPLPSKTELPPLNSPMPSIEAPVESATSVSTQEAARLTAAPPPSSAISPVIIVSQEGGIAGIQQSWEIYPDGAVVSGGVEVCRVGDSVISSILSSSSETGFFTTSYTSPPGICCDYFTFTLTLHSGERANTISISDGDSKAPQELRELLASVRQAVSCSY